MIDTIERFLDDEISSQEMYEAIYDFITSFHIRSGEFEGNRYIIKKMDRINFIIFPEDIYPNTGDREIPYCTSIYKNTLITRINEYAKTQGIKVIDMGE
ncbi:hypothetical protein QJV14_11190 [Listeria cossartiae subsp. cayugensis]|uniref:hypothetical protein n=1 Tax=Listeria cossartiae TaxID=2838249 RepID=UPI0028809874|nr:hypothetical protein [Listeria cossartiae]MDT0003985.1 hypothetical protein [Listeria cossartiae subsp. cayugensis]MDT0020379.1 hypothetical protein [Listeria cossartiae subsp. cayugensis]MDT0036406.1 hypothetical protein [Listeria cossartiae subsp. cayugensis]MDT0042130.1 hypothetical protein [Listeria cossartiae subsp. cayugensis]MDT0047481.1 hypothetical protein [Listeria cossartiae subsp. cayugensis]